MAARLPPSRPARPPPARHGRPRPAIETLAVGGLAAGLVYAISFLALLAPSAAAQVWHQNVSFGMATDAMGTSEFASQVVPPLDPERVLALCLPSLPPSLVQQPLLSDFASLKWPDSSLSSSFDPMRSYLEPLKVFAYGIVCPDGKTCDEAISNHSFNWNYFFLGRRSKDVGWMQAEWNWRRGGEKEGLWALLEGERGRGGQGGNASEGLEAERMMSNMHSLSIKSLGLLYRVPKGDGSYLESCHVGCRTTPPPPCPSCRGGDLPLTVGADGLQQTEDPCPLQFKLRYDLMQRSASSASYRPQDSASNWTGQLIVKTSSGEKNINIKSSNTESADYVFTLDEELKYSCAAATNDHSSSSLYNFMKWLYPQDFNQINHLYMQVDSIDRVSQSLTSPSLSEPATSGIHSSSSMTFGYGPSLSSADGGSLDILCEEREAREGEQEEEAFLPRGNVKKGCFPSNFWLFPQPFRKTVSKLNGTGKPGPEGEATGRVAVVLDVSVDGWSPSSSSIVFEGHYDKEFGIFCGMGCFQAKQFENGRPNSSTEAFPQKEETIEIETNPDCKVRLTIIFPRYLPWPFIYLRPPLRAEVESLRNPEDPLYFKPISFSRKNFMTAEEAESVYQRSESKLLGGILLGSFMVVCFALQIRYLRKKEEEVGSMSLLTPLSYCIGASLSALSFILNDTFRDLGSNVWNQYSPFSVAIPHPVQALFMVAVFLSGYLSYLIISMRKKRGLSWTGLKRNSARGEMELSLLEEEGEASVLPSFRKQTLTEAHVPSPSQFWGPQRSHIFCLPIYIIVFLISLGTLLQWYPLDFINSRVGRGDVSIRDDSWTLMEPGIDGNSNGASYAVPLYQTGVVIGTFGSFLQDLFLLPQVAHVAASDSSSAPPLHRVFAFGLSLARCEAHLLEPFGAPPMAVAGVVLLAVYYFMLTDYMRIKRLMKGW